MAAGGFQQERKEQDMDIGNVSDGALALGFVLLVISLFMGGKKK